MSFPWSHHYQPDSTQIVSTFVDADPSLLRLLQTTCFPLPNHPARLSRYRCVRECCKYHAYRKAQAFRDPNMRKCFFFFHLRTFQCLSNSTNRSLLFMTEIPRIERKKTKSFAGEMAIFLEEPFLAKRLSFRFLSCSLYMILAVILYQVASQAFNKYFADLDFHSSHKPTPCIRCFNSWLFLSLWETKEPPWLASLETEQRLDKDKGLGRSPLSGWISSCLLCSLENSWDGRGNGRCLD